MTIKYKLLSIIFLILFSLPLIAQTDYSLKFSTYLGGSAFEQIRDVVSDKDGNVYVTGGTQSEDFPTTEGAYQRVFQKGGTSIGNGGPMMVFVTKFSPSGELIWSTMIGGPNYDRAYAIELDDNGFIYIGGRASEGYPTTPGVVQEEFGGDEPSTRNGLYGQQDGFITKLSPDGTEIIWSTFIGSNDAGFLRDITIDDQGNVYGIMTNMKYENDIVPEDAFINQHQGGTDCMPFKISSDGSEVLWASYFGGTGNDGGGPAIRVDSEYNAYVYGSCNSIDLPVTENAYDKTYNGGSSDVFIAKFSPDGKELLYCTYFGGSGNDALETHGIFIDNDNQPNVIVPTNSKDIPCTATAYQKINKATNWSYAVAKFSADATELLASTYLGGSTGQGAESIFVDSIGRIYVGGGTVSDDYPVTENAIQRELAGGRDAFASILSPDCSELLFSTYFGGTADEGARCSWADNAGNFYIAGQTKSDDFPTKNAYQDIRKDTKGKDDNFVTVFGKNELSYVLAEESNSQIVKFFPNPVLENIDINIEKHNTESIESIEIITSLGIPVRKISISNNISTVITIDVSDFTTGLYFLKIGNKYYKFMKF